VACSTSAGAYSGHHLPGIACSNLSLTNLYALLKRSGRAGLFSMYHWYPVRGLLLVLASSRYVDPIHIWLCEVNVHSASPPWSPSPFPLHLEFSLLHCTERWVFLLFSIVFHRCFTRLILFLSCDYLWQISRSSWPTSTTFLVYSSIIDLRLYGTAA
jgi:hypothetical protein